MNKHKILIADSGATKTDWCLLEQGNITHQFKTKGISPIFQTEDEIYKEIKKHVYPQVEEKMPDAVFFYGSGCIPEKIETVKNTIQLSLQVNKVKVYSDLIAAVHALCGDKSGIACILGTGSNSCEWNGKQITNQVPPLGFILGDEGSAASMGKFLISDILKNQLSEELKKKFMKQYSLTPSIIINNVYKKPFPSRFLASISPFILQNIDDTNVKNIVKKSFTDFFQRNVMQYKYEKYNVNFVGSIAHYYSFILKEVALENKITIGEINQSPIKGLVNYYKSKVL